MTNSAAAGTDAARLRDELADTLIGGGWIASPEAEVAFRTVPRHLFAPPGTPLADAYADTVIRTKFDASGTCLSSVSAPWLQAKMIAQAGVKPGMRILEVGSGGYNAALLAEITGTDGEVVTIDIDPDVTARTTASLEAAGYTGRVSVVTGDAEHPVEGHGMFDAIIVTAGAWDIAPAWRHQLADSGTLVIPLRVHGGWTKSIAFQWQGGHLASISAQPCGFVPVQGAGALVEQAVAFDVPGGGHALVRCQDPGADIAGLPPNLLADGPRYHWSGITIAPMTSHTDLYLWLAGFTEGFCHVTEHDGATLPGDPGQAGKRWFPAAVARDRSLTYLTTRKTPADDWEFGACAYGPHADIAATAYLTAIADWTRHGRDLPEDAFAYWPSGISPALPDAPGPVALLPKRHGTLTLSWPAAPDSPPAPAD